MFNRTGIPSAASIAALAILVSTVGHAGDYDSDDYDAYGQRRERQTVQVGDRPYYLIDGMDAGPLKSKLEQCKSRPVRRTDFSIGHRGAALQFPEHTLESYTAAARQGAGIVECDVTFTREGNFVCRHAQNDLHTTTNILATPLAASCVTPFSPAVIDSTGRTVTPARAECRTSELTTTEFLSLRGKMDAANTSARTVAEYLGGTAPFRTDLYTGRGTLLTFRESIALNQKLGVKHTPELKSGDPASINAIFGSQKNYALKFAADMRAAGVKPRDTWPQSFNLEDVFTWIDHTEYGRQAVYLLDFNSTDPINDVIIQAPYNAMDRMEFLKMLKARGVRVIAPAMPALLAVDASGRIVPSKLANDLNAMGFQIITWTFERSDLRLGASRAGFYYDFDAAGAAVKKDSDMYKALDVLAKQVKVIGIFSDWPATVSYYASCMNLK
jgi:glycerophosphoryl diester phosphodiesterase